MEHTLICYKFSKLILGSQCMEISGEFLFGYWGLKGVGMPGCQYNRPHVRRGHETNASFKQ